MTVPQDITKLQSEMSAAVREHWKAFLFEGILLVVLGLAAIDRCRRWRALPSRSSSAGCF